MQDTRLTVRISRDVLEDAGGYAHRNRATLTRLVSEYLRRLEDEGDPLAEAPTVRRLAGALSPGVFVDDYRVYLEEKYGNRSPRAD